MRKFLLPILVIGVMSANGQVTLSPTGSPYTQNFDTIGTAGLPNGWTCQCASSSTSIGSIGHINLTPGDGIFTDTTTADGCAGAVFGGGFKNFASADVCPKNANCAAQMAITNRALGVRQVSSSNATAPNLDSGAAFIFQIANTTGMYNFKLHFNLQSLDTSSSARTTTWMVDYGFGSSPTLFTPVTTTGTMTTGGYVWSNNGIDVDFSTALDNNPSQVNIRIVTLLFSSGSGNRASTAIDDYSLSWLNTTTGITNVDNAPSATLTCLGNATPENVTIAYNVQEMGEYHFTLTDITGRTVYAETVNATNRVDKIEINGKHLAPGMYFAKLGNANVTCMTRAIVH